MAGITFGGLATGLDTNALITGLMAAERVPYDALTTKSNLVAGARATISAMSSKLNALKTAADALSDPAGFASLVATSSDAAVVASTSGTGSAGTYDVSVTQLAREQRSYSTTSSSDATALGMAGTLSMTIGGTVTNVTIDSADSLGSIATKLNASGARVGAAVMFDGTNYRLQVRGLDTGAANAVTFGETGFSLGLTGTPYQTAQDAKLKVDGIDVTRSTNLITGVIPGVSLALTKTTSSAQVRVAGDPTAVQKKLETFVSAYNDIVNTGHSAAGYGTGKASNSLLSGDVAIRTTLDRISSLISTPVAGTTGRYTTLGSVGLGTDRDGKLQFDATKFASALATDPNVVARLFVTDATTGATGAMKSFSSTVDGLVTGDQAPFTGRLAALDALTKQIGNDQTSMQLRLDKTEERLRKQFTQLEMTASAYKTQASALSNIGGWNFK